MNCPICHTEKEIDIPTFTQDKYSIELMPCTNCGSDLFVNVKEGKIKGLTNRASFGVLHSNKSLKPEIFPYSDRVLALYTENKALTREIEGLRSERVAIHLYYKQVKDWMDNPRCFICQSKQGSHNETCPLRALGALYGHQGDIFGLVK